MLHKVVVPFPCSWDGVTSVDLEIGDERDFGSMADGLVAEGWIEEIKEPEWLKSDDASLAPAVAVAKPVNQRRQRN